MADNRGVAYMGAGKVEVQDIDFPTFELQDGPGVNPANVGRKLPHAAILTAATRRIGISSLERIGITSCDVDVGWDAAL